MNSIEKIQKDIVEEFNLFDDWQDKYEHLIELGKEMETLPEKHKNQSNIIDGCQVCLLQSLHIN